MESPMSEPRRKRSPPWMVGEVDLRYVIRVPPPVRRESEPPHEDVDLSRALRTPPPVGTSR
jgi:hypothetical protein